MRVSWSALCVMKHTLTGRGGGGGSPDSPGGGGGGSPGIALELEPRALPAALSRLTGLTSLEVARPAPRWAAGVGALPRELPDCVAALPRLAELDVYGAAPPRRRMGAMRALATLALRGWDAVVGAAVHLHKLPALADLNLDVEGAAGAPLAGGEGALRALSLSAPRPHASFPLSLAP